MYTEHKQTLIENWPEALLTLSFQSEGIELRERDVFAIGACTHEFMDAKKLLERPAFSEQLRDDIEYALSRFTGPVFVSLHQLLANPMQRKPSSPEHIGI